MIQLGVVIEKGPQNWQVLQQREGSASFLMTGSYFGNGNDDPGSVCLRICSERTGRAVTDWAVARTQHNGKWEAELKMETGGPYRIETCLKKNGSDSVCDALRGDLRHHVFSGDLFVIGGQSNAAGYAGDSVEDPAMTGVSVYRNNNIWDLATHPLNDSTGCQRVNLDWPCPAHSPFLAFAKRIYTNTGIPVGLIPAALGGSPIASWNPDCGELYRNMRELILSQPGGVRGVLWYQGCTDAIELKSEQYEESFLYMVKKLREETRIPDLPFFTCQLNRLTDPSDNPKDLSWSRVREVQRKAAVLGNNIFVTPTMDLPLFDCIHNNAESNILLGKRLADKALAVLYNGSGSGDAPDIRKIEKQNGKILLTFHPAESVLRCDGNDPADAFRAFRQGQRLTVTEVVLTGGNQIFLNGENLDSADCLALYYGQNPDGPTIRDDSTGLPVLAFLKNI